MTVRGFLAWYLAAIVVVSASGAGAWLGIQSRKHLDTAVIVTPPVSESSSPSPQVADAEPMKFTSSDQVEGKLPKLRPPQSIAAPLPLPPLHVLTQSHDATQTASGANRSWIAGLRPRPARKVAARSSAHRYPQTVVAQQEVYPYEGPGPYVQAYPPAPWQVNRHAYYYPQYGYYPHYSYYYYPAN